MACFGRFISVLMAVNSLVPTISIPLIGVDWYINNVIVIVLASIIIGISVNLFIIYNNMRDLQNSIGGLNLRFISKKEKLMDELFNNQKSVVKAAKDRLIIVGSRSRDLGYLSEIESQFQKNAELNLTRILIGPPKDQVLIDHISRLKAFSEHAGQLNKERLKIVQFELGGELPERFICVSDDKALIVTQSVNSPLGYDTGIVIEDREIAQKLLGQLQGLAEQKERETRAA